MNTSKFHQISKGDFCRKYTISTERKGLLKSGKFLNLTGHIGNKTRQLSVSLIWYPGRSILSNAGPFLLTNPVSQTINLIEPCYYVLKILS